MKHSEKIYNALLHYEQVIEEVKKLKDLDDILSLCRKNNMDTGLCYYFLLPYPYDKGWVRKYEYLCRYKDLFFNSGYLHPTVVSACYKDEALEALEFRRNILELELKKSSWIKYKMYLFRKTFNKSLIDFFLG